jgi:hypothetical protein
MQELCERFGMDSCLGITGHSRRCIILDTLIRDGPWNFGVQEISSSYDDFLAANMILVGPKHVFVEDLHGNLVDKRMRNPGA